MHGGQVGLLLTASDRLTGRFIASLPQRSIEDTCRGLHVVYFLHHEGRKGLDGRLECLPLRRRCRLAAHIHLFVGEVRNVDFVELAPLLLVACRLAFSHHERRDRRRRERFGNAAL